MLFDPILCQCMPAKTNTKLLIQTGGPTGIVMAGMSVKPDKNMIIKAEKEVKKGSLQ